MTAPLKTLDLFSGIGGFSLGLENTGGFKTVAFCEINPFCQKVLNKHWPDVQIFDDVKEVNGEKFKGTVDVVCGGFPCQDLSVAGKKAGFSGEKSSLYREMLRIISQCLPRYAIFENVTGLLSGDNGRWFAKFLYDLDAIGYDAQWHCISASFIGAPHHRDRVWVIAYPHSQRCNHGANNRQERHVQNNQERFTKESKPKRNRRQHRPSPNDDTGLSTNSCGGRPRDHRKHEVVHNINGINQSSKRSGQTVESGVKCSAETQVSTHPKNDRHERFATLAQCIQQQVELVRSDPTKRERFNLSEPALYSANDGVSDRLVRAKLNKQRTNEIEALGNSVVPLIPEIIGNAILQYEREIK